MAMRIIESLKALTLCSSLVTVFALAQLSAAATREQWIEGEKKEGEVILYASMNLAEANTMISRFEKSTRL